MFVTYYYSSLCLALNASRVPQICYVSSVHPPRPCVCLSVCLSVTPAVHAKEPKVRRTFSPHSGHASTFSSSHAKHFSKIWRVSMSADALNTHAIRIDFRATSSYASETIRNMMRTLLQRDTDRSWWFFKQGIVDDLEWPWERRLLSIKSQNAEILYLLTMILLWNNRFML